MVHDAGADGVIVGNALVRTLEEAPSAERGSRRRRGFIRGDQIGCIAKGQPSEARKRLGRGGTRCTASL